MGSDRRYHVVVDDLEHYSIWPEGRALPPGWQHAGVSGTKRECLDHVTRVWLAMDDDIDQQERRDQHDERDQHDRQPVRRGG